MNLKSTKPPSAERMRELQGLVRLTVEATQQVTTIVEGMHRNIAYPPFLPLPRGEARTRGLTGFVYQGIRGISGLVGQGLDLALESALRLSREDTQDTTSAEYDALRSVVNGVLGDYLEQSDNPLALPMTFRFRGQRIDPQTPEAWPTALQPRSRVLLAIHGLCMNDRQWQRDSVDLIGEVARRCEMTPLWLRYNTGRSIERNGEELAEQLETLLQHWPVPVTSLALVGHSMGGLVARSACRAGELGNRTWRKALHHMVFLGSPHLGAPLEQAGHGLHQLLAFSRYSAPLAALGDLRSAGIIDLRHGLDYPLPKDVACHAIASTLGGTERDHHRFIGDGLVPLHSALGDHPEPHRNLGIDAEKRHVIERLGHIDLLYHPDVIEALTVWLKAKPGEGAA